MEKKLGFRVEASNSTSSKSKDLNSIDFSDGVEINLAVVCGIKIGLVLASGLSLNCFLCGGQNQLRSCVRAESYLVLAYGSTLTCFLSWGSKLTWFCVRAENDLFMVWASIYLVFVRVVEVGFRVLAGNHLVLVGTSNLTSFLCGWYKKT